MTNPTPPSAASIASICRECGRRFATRHPTDGRCPACRMGINTPIRTTPAGFRRHD